MKDRSDEGRSQTHHLPIEAAHDVTGKRQKGLRKEKPNREPAARWRIWRWC